MSTTYYGKPQSAAAQGCCITPSMGIHPTTNTCYTNCNWTSTNANLFGSLRAGAQIFPHLGRGCPACGHIDNSIAHILRSCKNTRHSLNAWLQQVDPSTGSTRMMLSEQAFTQSILNLSSISTREDRRATVTLIWDSTQAAIKAATRRRDDN